MSSLRQTAIFLKQGQLQASLKVQCLHHCGRNFRHAVGEQVMSMWPFRQLILSGGSRQQSAASTSAPDALPLTALWYFGDVQPVIRAIGMHQQALRVRTALHCLENPPYMCSFHRCRLLEPGGCLCPSGGLLHAADWYVLQDTMREYTGFHYVLSWYQGDHPQSHGAALSVSPSTKAKLHCLSSLRT